MKKLFLFLCIPFAACSTNLKVEQWYSTTPGNEWASKKYAKNKAPAQFNVSVDVLSKLQTVEGFGACFNELGWTSLGYLNESDRESIMKEMFAPGVGSAFTVCRMPVAANDFARNWYSYCETPGDFNMETFSIDNDKETLIPFIKNAQKFYPELRVWASPWSPPTWMKYNNHYACKPSPQFNDLPGDPKLDREGENMFIQEDAYFAAYAEYFSRFIDSYRGEGIDIFAVAPQNEFNSCQIFPSCTWQASGLNKFVGEYLGPRMADKGVEIILGTLERADFRLADTLLNDPLSSRYIGWVAFQWAGKGAVEAVHKAHPDMKIMQSESECGDGTNSWDYCFYTWDLMKHYFKNGTVVYQYWNISLEADALSRWGWRQNSLVSVDKNARTFKYNPEYYLMKHYSKYVRPGARLVSVAGDYDDILAFVNEDGSVVVIMANKGEQACRVNVGVGGISIAPELEPRSINTFVLK